MKKNVLLIFILILVFILTFNTISYCSDSLFAGQWYENDIYYILADKYTSYDYVVVSFEPGPIPGSNYRDGYYLYVIYSENEFFTDLNFSSDGSFKTNDTLYLDTYGLTNELLLDTNSVSPSRTDSYTNTSFASTASSLDFLIYSTFDIKDITSNEVIFGNTVTPEFKNPYFITTQEELETGNIDKLVISGGDYKDTDDIFYLQSMYYPKDVTEDESFQSLFPVKEIALRPFYSEYYVGVNNSNEYIYEIPRADLGIDLIEGNKYAFHLGVYDGDLFNRLARLSFTVGVVNPDDVTNDKLDQQTDAIKENTETQKGIWETIKDILSYINPFSENFFVYKLIELLVEAIKSLFIPSDDFLGTYFTDLKEWFSDRLGFLFYPFELVIDILNMILDIDFSEPVFNIPDITEPFSNKKLISATTFKFNDLLENNTFNTIHSIYLVCVDVFVVFGLVNLFRKKYEEVTTK